ncbi:hypothetical protein [Endozoicomonas elysicola]|uniref:Uncharacterized protein n=1 Tax=Endozoicomonas elysicola TaxID=305900 RepID=A0A081K5K2_9GAMM|nr:hypothetical protein [Endozoicomonas elysicola]KEI69428.1 hypothetical protein GV64_00585 [Endozoicomonas elysicola]
MDSSGIGSLSTSQINQINKLASKKGADNQVLIAKHKGREVRFEAVTPKVSSKAKQKELDSGSRLAVETLGLKDRKVSPSMAQTILNIREKVNSSTHASFKDLDFLNEHLVSSYNSLESDLNISLESLDSGIESDFSGSTESLDSIVSDIDSNFSGSIESLDSLDAEGQPIFRTFPFKRPSEQTDIEQKESQPRSELKRRGAIRRESIVPPDLPPKRQKQTAPPRPDKPEHLSRPELPPKRKNLPGPPVPPRQPLTSKMKAYVPTERPLPDLPSSSTKSPSTKVEPAPRKESLLEVFSKAPELNKTGFASLDSKAQIAELKTAKNAEQTGKFLDQCTAKQRMALSKNKNFPKHCWPAMNQRLLADALEAHSSKNTGGMYRVGGSQTALTKAVENFNKKRVPDSVLNDRIDAAQLFKRTHDSQKLFSADTFRKFSAVVQTDPIDYQRFNQELDDALAGMPPDSRDQAMISLKVMRNAYLAAPQERASNTAPDAPVAKNDLASLFAESTLTFQKTPAAATQEEALQAMAIAAKEQAAGLKVMTTLLSQR